MKPDNQKSPQAVAAAREDQRVLCDRCGSLILKSDNYCSYCRKPINQETMERERELKLSVFSLSLAIVILLVVLCS